MPGKFHSISEPLSCDSTSGTGGSAPGNAPGPPILGILSSTMSSIFGSGELFDAASVQRLYPGGEADYLERFAVSLDAVIQSGFVLAADRDEILELAVATFPSEDDLRVAGLRASD